jgi:hypothetical protein
LPAAVCRIWAGNPKVVTTYPEDIPMAQLLSSPDLNAQRAAMKKLEFLVGKWIGEAHLVRGTSQVIDMDQAEEVQYKLDGLILLIEGVGRAKSDGRLLQQALAVISYDDGNRTYRMRAFNDGRFLETEITLLEEGNGMTWGFALADVKTKSICE